MSDPATIQERPPHLWPIGLWFAAAVGLSLFSSILSRLAATPPPLRIAAAFLPIVAIAGAVLTIRRTNAKLDEFQRRLQLEALATAFIVAAAAFIAYNQLQIAGLLGPEDWIFPWLAIWLGYLFGYRSARSRYQ